MFSDLDGYGFSVAQMVNGVKWTVLFRIFQWTLWIGVHLWTGWYGSIQLTGCLRVLQWLWVFKEPGLNSI